MGLWQRFVAWLFRRSPRPTRDPDTPIEIDEAAFAEELQILAEAQRLGKAGQPAPDATRQPAIEARTIHLIDKARLSHIRGADRRLVVLNGDLARLDITALVDRALQAHKEFARRADALINERRNVLAQLGESARRARQTLEMFRRKNGLTRNPRYPEGVGKLLRVVLLAVFVAVEAGVNSRYFATGVEGGLIGGFGNASMLAFINVFVAALLGRYVVREFFHCQATRKICGAVGLAFAVVTMVGISLGIAHYRDALEADVEAPSKVALEVIRQTPFGLADLDSWFLFVLSFLFAGFALVDGLGLDDRYPGYGRHAREDANADEAYQEEIQDLREALEELKEELLKRLDDDTQTAKASVVRQEDLLEQKEKTRGRLNEAMFNAQRCMEALIAQFREENEIHRKPLPAPASFSVMPMLEELALPDFKIEAGSAALVAQKERLKELLAGLQPVKAAIQSGFTQKFDALQSLDEQLRPTDAQLAEYLSEVTA